MQAWHHLALAISAALPLWVLSCRSASQTGSDSFWNKPAGAPSEYGLETPKERLLPAYLNEDGSLKKGYDILDARHNSPRVCPLHQVQMQDELSTDRHTQYDWEAPGYRQFQEEGERLFPHAHQLAATPWTKSWRDSRTMLIRFCAECRNAQQRWLDEAGRENRARAQ